MNPAGWSSSVIAEQDEDDAIACAVEATVNVIQSSMEPEAKVQVIHAIMAPYKDA